MKQRRAIHVMAAMAAMALMACGDRRMPTALHEQYPQVPDGPALNAHEATLLLSDLAPKDGNTLVVAGVVSLADSLTVGSFVARLAYDPARLHYLGESDEDGMMRVINPEAGSLTIAAASSTGSKTGRLFTFRFRVDDPVGVSSLLLSLKELNDATYVNRLPTIRMASTPRLDSTLAPKRINTR